jgi:hypothetical protein
VCKANERVMASSVAGQPCCLKTATLFLQAVIVVEAGEV